MACNSWRPLQASLLLEAHFRSSPCFWGLVEWNPKALWAYVKTGWAHFPGMAANLTLRGKTLLCGRGLPWQPVAEHLPHVPMVVLRGIYHWKYTMCCFLPAAVEDMSACTLVGVLVKPGYTVWSPRSLPRKWVSQADCTDRAVTLHKILPLLVRSGIMSQELDSLRPLQSFSFVSNFLSNDQHRIGSKLSWLAMVFH